MIAEKPVNYQADPRLYDSGIVPVINIAEQPRDQFTRHQAAHFVARVLRPEFRSNLVEMDNPQSIHSLKDAIHLARSGDEKGYQVLYTNVWTDTQERTIKVENIMPEVELEVDDNGDIHQYGHSSEDIQANSLKFAANHPAMRGRVKAEVRNSFRLKQEYNQGNLDDYVFVVLSRAADNMSKADMDKAGFFTETMSTSIQATTVKDGVLTTESAFVAGVKTPGSDRHDGLTIVALGKMLGVDFTGKNATEIIDMPLMVHKSLLPNGVVDLVKMYDECAGGTFFGQDRPQQDYLAFREACRVRAAGYKQKVQAIVNEIIAKADSVHTEIDATRLLSKVSGQHMVEKAVEDDSINPMVFGAEAAQHIEQARLHRTLGNEELAEAALKRAKATEKSASCPGEELESADTDIYGFSKSCLDDCKEIKNGDITNCPYCGKKGVVARVKKPGGQVYCDNTECEYVDPDLKSSAHAEEENQPVATVYELLKAEIKRVKKANTEKAAGQVAKLTLANAV